MSATAALQETAETPEVSADDKKAKDRGFISRRSLVLGTGGIAALLGLGCLKFTPAEALVRPPGGK